jgi:hypothetical protein
MYCCGCYAGVAVLLSSKSLISLACCAVAPYVTLSAYIAEMCGRFTRNYTWEQIQALYRLTAPAAIPNLQPRFNACPTDPADTIVERESKSASSSRCDGV